MKRWNVIHKIKSLHDGGNGLSIRAISKELGISRNSVRKYVRLDEASIAQQQDNPARSKQLDAYRDYLISLLASFPGLSAVKIARKLTEKLGELPASDRSIRRYVSALKEEVATGQLRYYEPVVAVFFKIVVTIFTSSSLFYLGLFFRVQCDWANRLAVSNRT